MKVILEKMIEGKSAQLLLDENKVVNVVYDKILLSRNEGNTFNILESNDMLEDYLDMLVESYLKDKRNDEEFEEVCKNLDWS